MALARHLTLSLTGEVTAVGEVQALHAFGEDECTDITGEATAVAEVQFLHAFGEDACTDITCGKRGGEKQEEGDSEERKTVYRGCLKRVALARHLTLSLTGETRAVVEDQVLHAFGEDECTDITCEGRTKKEMCEDGRRESAAAHG